MNALRFLVEIEAGHLILLVIAFLLALGWVHMPENRDDDA